MMYEPPPQKMFVEAGIDSDPEQQAAFVYHLLYEGQRVMFSCSDGTSTLYGTDPNREGGMYSQCGGSVSAIMPRTLPPLPDDYTIVRDSTDNIDDGSYHEGFTFGMYLLRIEGHSPKATAELIDLIEMGLEASMPFGQMSYVDTAHCLTLDKGHSLLMIHMSCDPETKCMEATEEDEESCRHRWDDLRKDSTALNLNFQYENNAIGGMDLVYWHISTDADGFSVKCTLKEMEDKIHDNIKRQALGGFACITTNMGEPGRQTYQVMAFVRDNQARFNADGFAVLLPSNMASNPNENHHDIDSVTIVPSLDYCNKEVA